MFGCLRAAMHEPRDSIGSQSTEPDLEDGSVYRICWWALLGSIGVSYFGVVSNDHWVSPS